MNWKPTCASGSAARLPASERAKRHAVPLRLADRGVPPSQIILTTQSPYVIDQMNLDEILWVEKKKGETKVVRPSDKANLRKLVEDEVLGLGDLMFTGALGEE